MIRILGRYPGLSPGEVAAILHLHPSTLTGIMKRLATRGVVERRPDPDDARRARSSYRARPRVDAG